MVNVTEFPTQKPVEWIIGPFPAKYRVVIDGRRIPNLNARPHDDGSVTLVVDGRFAADFPDNNSAYQAARLIANAMAIGAGYPSLNAETKDRPFAPLSMKIDPKDTPNEPR